MEQLNNIKAQITEQIDTVTSTEFGLKVATVLAYIVGVTVFFFDAVSNWYKNGGKESIALLTMNVLRFINTTSESLYYSVEETVDKPREV